MVGWHMRGGCEEDQSWNTKLGTSSGITRSVVACGRSVVERSADVKHGRPGFSGVVVSGPEKGNPVWGYDYQIVELRLAAAPSSPVGYLHMDGGSAGAAYLGRSERSTLRS